ncbi:MAG: tellurium resistance protein, partial [Dehalococcoidia bacterium]|nr:tellurium resistance protein [Dehalococcoidia bacterium]
RGRALDVATGMGRNALFLAQQGFAVDAVDISSAGLAIARQKALETGLTVNWIQADLDTFGLPSQTYDLIIDNFYLNRPLAPKIIEALTPEGILIFEHHVLPRRDTACRVSTPRAPMNPELKLKHGELKALFRSLDILHYKEESVLKEGDFVPIARLVGRKFSRVKRKETIKGVK